MATKKAPRHAKVPAADRTNRKAHAAAKVDIGAMLAQMMGTAMWLVVRTFKSGKTDKFTVPATMPEDAICAAMTDDLSQLKDLQKLEVYDEGADGKPLHVLIIGTRADDGTLNETLTDAGKAAMQELATKDPAGQADKGGDDLGLGAGVGVGDPSEIGELLGAGVGDDGTDADSDGDDQT